MTPLVSVIMPAYNAEKYLDLAIISVINQTYCNWELLIINDGSVDATSSVIDGYQDSRIKYFEQTNRGVSAARNVGLENASGEFICFLDADDMMPSNSISTRLNVFMTYPAVDFVDGSIEICDSTMENVSQVRKQQYRGKALPALLRLDNRCFFGNTWMIRNSINNQVLFQEGMTHGEDLLYYIEHARKGGEYMAVEDVVLKYRRSAVTAMTNLDGLSKGYQQLYGKVSEMVEVTFFQKILLNAKIKKIMALSYLNKQAYLKALKSLLYLP